MLSVRAYSGLKSSCLSCSALILSFNGLDAPPPSGQQFSLLMSTRPTYASDEEWCLLSDAEGNDRSSVGSDGDDEVEPEPELVPRYTSAVSSIKQATSIGASAGTEVNTPLESCEVLSLLSETLPSKELADRREAAYSRAVRLSLLSTEHRNRIQGVETDAQVPGYDTKARGNTSVKVAFGFPSSTANKKRSYPDRLRETVESFRDVEAVGEPCRPAYTPVEAFVQDRATQTDPPTQAPTVDASRVGLFRAALERTLALSAQHHTKSQECERLSLRVMELQRRLDDAESRQQDDEKLQCYQRSMTIANERLALGLEYQGRLRGTVADLTDENQSLKRQNAILSGQESNLNDQSVLKLEALEDALALAMDNVRTALRAKYRAAIDKAQSVDTIGAKDAKEEEERCVVCLTQLATVKSTPCGHRVLCPACAVRIDTCPIDRLPIEDKVLTFGLDAYTNA